MKIIAITSALIVGVSLVAIQVRHTGSILKAIFGMDYKWLSDKLDKLILFVAGIFFVVFLVAIILVV
jgi:hypothetical protein